MAPNKSIFRKYRLLPLTALGVGLFLILALLGLMIWTLVAYTGHLDVSTGPVPAIIWLAALFLSAAAMTALIKGGTVFPAAILALVAVAASLLLVEPEQLTLGGAALKLLWSLLAAAVGFTLVKLYFVGRRPLRAQRQASLSDPKARPGFSDPAAPIAPSAIKEPEPAEPLPPLDPPQQEQG